MAQMFPQMTMVGTSNKMPTQTTTQTSESRAKESLLVCGVTCFRAKNLREGSRRTSPCYVGSSGGIDVVHGRQCGWDYVEGQIDVGLPPNLDPEIPEDYLASKLDLRYPMPQAPKPLPVKPLPDSQNWEPQVT